jgi:hypothetical protein
MVSELFFYELVLLGLLWQGRIIGSQCGPGVPADRRKGLHETPGA